MAINISDFDKIWASTSPLTPYAFTDANYQQGWNFVGATPPARQMWDSYMKWSDEKQQYIVNNFLSLSGGTMTGNISLNSAMITNSADDTYTTVCGGTDDNGSYLRIHGKNSTYAGVFGLRADNGVNNATLLGNPDGTLTWGGKEVERVNASGTNYIRYESGLQICWKAESYVTSSGKAITYPVAFSANPTLAFSMGVAQIAYYGSNSTTGCTLYINSTSNFNVNYIAVGYWK